MDFVETHPIPPRLREPVRAVLGGAAGEWPGELTAGEVAALTAHGVAPLLYAATGHPGLRGEAIRAAAFEEPRLAALRDLLALLAARDVEALVMKGSALAQQVFPAPELRPRGDTDLLVSAASLPRLRAAMLEAGFVEQPSSGDEHGVRQAMFRGRDARGIDHLYDVHWDVANTPLFSGALRFEEVVARSVALPLTGGRALSLSDALLLACIHRVAHHYDSEKLIWLVDIALLRERMSEEEHRDFWRTAADRRVVTVCSRSIALADEWTGRRPSYPASQFLTAGEISRAEPSAAFLDRQISYGGVMLANLRVLPWRARLERLWQLAFPPPAFMRTTAGGSPAPLPWLYARRGARGLRRLFTRASSTRL